MDEREVLRVWRDLFRGSAASPETLAQAETLLDGLSGESPLHLRLANELNELKRGAEPPTKKQPARRKVTKAKPV